MAGRRISRLAAVAVATGGLALAGCGGEGEDAATTTQAREPAVEQGQPSGPEHGARRRPPADSSGKPRRRAEPEQSRPARGASEKSTRIAQGLREWQRLQRRLARADAGDRERVRERLRELGQEFREAAGDQLRKRERRLEREREEEEREREEEEERAGEERD